ncbi:hypothetical protein AC578_181, partial [Pseudocercospora eumusae]
MPYGPARQWYEGMKARNERPRNLEAWQEDEEGFFTIHPGEKWCCAKLQPPLGATQEEINNPRVCTFVCSGTDIGNNLRCHVKRNHLRDGYRLRDAKRGRKKLDEKANAEAYFKRMFENHIRDNRPIPTPPQQEEQGKM